MKKVIDGKLYNTETARLIKTIGADTITDINQWGAKLYQTKKGEYFLHRYSGANSCEAIKTTSGSYIDGENIYPANLENIAQWVDSHYDEWVFERLFQR